MPPAPVKPIITTEDLEKLDVRVGTIRDVAEVPGSRKLVKLRVDFGDHHRQILAGLKAERPDPAALTMAGEISEGMLFDIGYADGITPVLAVPERPVPPGTRAG
jgi:tRNA-binding protein